MLRPLFVVVAALSLSGCWISETRLFGAGDWAQLDIAGAYTSENATGDVEASVVLSVRADGLVDGVSTPVDEDKTEDSVVGFVPIAGGSGDYFLMVDRSSQQVDGEIYFIAHLEDDGAITVYWPQCPGTPDVAGMRRDVEQLIDEEICIFGDKAAVMRAALEAEKVLSAPQMFEPQHLGRLVPEDAEEDAATD